MLSPALQTRELSIGYADMPLLKGLNLNLYPATLTVLLGRNGGGKSTLIRTLAGLQPLLGGSITIGTDSIAKQSSEWLARRVAVVLTERPHTQFMSGYELVALGRAPYTGWTGRLAPHDRQLIERALQAVHATDLQDLMIEELSDGQCQKLLIARALAQDTPLLLLDEPMAHLDLANSAQLLNSLSSYAKAYRKAILLSAHHVELAIRMADHLWLIDRDNKLHSGLPEQFVLEGKISNLFSGSHVSFDQSSGHFVFPAAAVQRTVAVSLELPEIEVYWLSQALAKRGIQLQHSSNASNYIRPSATHFRYEWRYGSRSGQADMAELVQIFN
ncbi:ABC transporter ATP-binding protein [Rhodoflexus sp.]